MGAKEGLQKTARGASGKLGDHSGGVKARGGEPARLQEQLGSGEDPENCRGSAGTRMDYGRNTRASGTAESVPLHPGATLSF